MGLVAYGIHLGDEGDVGKWRLPVHHLKYGKGG